MNGKGHVQIRIVDYDPLWPRLFQRESDRIRAALDVRALQIEHTGSTSVPGLAAKPVIDILLVVVDSANESEYTPALEGSGYRLHIREPGWNEHRMFKGPDADINLHVLSHQCPEIALRRLTRAWHTTRPVVRQNKIVGSQGALARYQRHANLLTDAIQVVVGRVARGVEHVTLRAS